jgi:hypothetical protein
VVGVVFFFAGDVLFHGEVPGEAGAGGADEGIEVGEVVIGAVFGDESFTVEELERGVGLFLSEFAEGALDEEGEEEGKRGFHCLLGIIGEVRKRKNGNRGNKCATGIS